MQLEKGNAVHSSTLGEQKKKHVTTSEYAGAETPAGVLARGVLGTWKVNTDEGTYLLRCSEWNEPAPSKPYDNLPQLGFCELYLCPRDFPIQRNVCVCVSWSGRPAAASSSY